MINYYNTLWCIRICSNYYFTICSNIMREIQMVGNPDNIFVRRKICGKSAKNKKQNLLRFGVCLLQTVTTFYFFGMDFLILIFHVSINGLSIRK